MSSRRGDLENLAAIARGNAEITCCVEYEIPDVFRLRIKIDGSGKFARGMVLIRGSFGRLGRTGAALDAVDLAVGIRGCVNHALLVHDDRLHLQLLRFKNRCGIPRERNPVDARWRAGRGVNDAGRICGD